MEKNNINKNISKGKISIYKSPKKEVELRVRFEGETVWLRQNEIATLFAKNRSVITRHINKIFADKEVNKKSNVHFLHIATSDKPVAYYSLDVILAVGYRTNSSRAIHFRQWATNVLKQHILQGYTIKQERLLETREKFRELQDAIAFLENKVGKKQIKGQEQEILSLLTGYAKTLSILEQYDQGKLEKPKGRKAEFILEYEDCQKIIIQLKKGLVAKKEASGLFGNETDEKFQSITKNLYQTFDAKELYKNIEEKSAHLLYLTIKDHPFVDGNKRIASFLFVYFLDKNDYLYRKTGERKINDNALTTLSILIAVSDPKDKDILIKIITNLLNDEYAL